MNMRKCAGFTEQELYDMWIKFKDNEEAASILSDFMVSTIVIANALIENFEIRYATEALNYANRGKFERIKKHI